MIMPFALEGIVLYSEDLERARAFYRDVLGLPLLLDEGHVIHFDAGTVRLAIHRCPPSEGREAPEGFLVFGVDDLAAAHEELRRRGAVFLGPPADRPYGRVAYLHDPEGHEIGLLEEPRRGTEGHRRVAPLVGRYERVIKSLGRLDRGSQDL
jgi:predicted enzyme related to lactoylglutathione lyase